MSRKVCTNSLASLELTPLRRITYLTRHGENGTAVKTLFDEGNPRHSKWWSGAFVQNFDTDSDDEGKPVPRVNVFLIQYSDGEVKKYTEDAIIKLVRQGRMRFSYRRTERGVEVDSSKV
jgi:hypothetical protein